MKKGSIAESYIFTLIYNLLTVITPLITAPYVARVLEPDGVGIYSLTSTNVNYFIVFGVLGLGTYGQLEIAKVKDDISLRSKKFYEIYLTRFITHGISIICLGVLLFSIEQYKTIYYVQGMIMLSSMFDVTWFFQGIEEYKKISLRNITIKVICVILIFAFVKTKNDLLIYTIINVAMVIVSSLCFIPTLSQYICKIKYRELHFRSHIKGAVVFFVPSVASIITSSFDKTMIDLITVSPVENGYYAQANRMEVLCWSMFSSLNVIMRSRMAYMFNSGQKEDMRALMAKSIRFVVLLAFPIALGMAGMSYSFVPWFFGDGYEKVSLLMIIFAGWMIFKPISNCVLEQDIMASGRQKVFNVIIWVGAISNIILNVIMIPFFASVGAAVASVFSELIIFILAIVYSSDSSYFRNIMYSSWKNMISAIVMVSVMVIVGSIMDAQIFTTIIQCILGAVTYFVMLILFRDQLCSDFIKMLSRNNDQ